MKKKKKQLKTLDRTNIVMVNLQNFVKIIHFWFKVIKDRLNMRSNGRHVIYLLLFTNKFMRIHGIPFGWNSVANCFLLCLILQK